MCNYISFSQFKKSIFITTFVLIYIFTFGQDEHFTFDGKNIDSQGNYSSAVTPANYTGLPQQQVKSGNSWSSVGPFGGDVLDVAIYTENPDVMIATAGIPFISYNGGDSWEFLESLSTAAQGKKFNTVECLEDGTFIAGGLYISGKAYKSSDGGLTWQPFYYTSAGGVYDIAVSQSNPDIIYMAVSGTYSTTSNRLIIKSTDGGESWTYFNMIGILPVGASAVSVAIDPDNSETVFFVAQSGISEGYVMVSFDGGENWEDKTSNLPGSKPYNVVAIANQTVYVGGGQLFGNNVLGIYESTNWGTSWQSISGSFPNKVVNDILINPVNNDKMYVGTEGDGVYSTSDGGANWSYNTSGAGDNGNVRSLIFAPGNTDKLYAGFLSLGVCKSDDAGADWSYANHGIAALLINDIEVDVNNPQIILASFEAENSGGCYLSNNGGGSWYLVEDLPATRFSVVSVGPDGTLYAWGDGPTTIAAEGLYKSVDGGTSWDNMGPNIGPQYETQIYALAVSASNPDLIFIGGNNFGVNGWESMIYKTTDGGQNWVNVYQGPEHDSFRYIFIDPYSNDQTVYSAFGSQNKGGFLKSTDAGESWDDISNGVPSSTIGVSVIVSDPVNPDILYGGVGGYGSTSGSVYKSMDAGNNWEATGLSFSSWSKITDIYVSELDQNVIYAASNDHGIYLTKTGGEEWFAANDGMPSSHITSFSRSFTEDDTLKIIASSYTNSAFKSNVYIPGTTSSKALSDNLFNVIIYPNPAKGSCNIKLNLVKPAEVKITIYNSSGNKIKTLEKGHFSSGNSNCSFSGKPGIYLIETEVNGEVRTDKVVIR